MVQRSLPGIQGGLPPTPHDKFHPLYFKSHILYEAQQAFKDARTVNVVEQFAAEAGCSIRLEPRTHEAITVEPTKELRLYNGSEAGYKHTRLCNKEYWLPALWIAMYKDVQSHGGREARKFFGNFVKHSIMVVARNESGGGNQTAEEVFRGIFGVRALRQLRLQRRESEIPGELSFKHLADVLDEAGKSDYVIALNKIGKQDVVPADVVVAILASFFATLRGSSGTKKVIRTLLKPPVFTRPPAPRNPDAVGSGQRQ